VTRALSSQMQAAAAALTGEVCLLLELQLGSGTIRLTTARADISWNSQAWQAVGGALAVDLLPETVDGRASGAQLSLSGVNPAILSLVLGETYRGRVAKLWLVHFDGTTGAIVVDPVLLFVGFLNDSWNVREERRRDESTVTLSTRVTSRYAALRVTRGIRCNPAAHRAALAAFAPSGYDTDTFFAPTAALAAQQIKWGSAPSTPFTWTAGNGPGLPTGGRPSPGGSFPSFPVPRAAPRPG
jgi:hypothetical protein